MSVGEAIESRDRPSSGSRRDGENLWQRLLGERWPQIVPLVKIRFAQ
jgi:hypothetical protein